MPRQRALSAQDHCTTTGCPRYGAAAKPPRSTPMKRQPALSLRRLHQTDAAAAHASGSTGPGDRFSRLALGSVM